MHMGLGIAAVTVPLQLFFGHQPSKRAAIEARWRDEKPAIEVLLVWPDVANRRNLFAITLPAPFGSLIDSDTSDRTAVPRRVSSDRDVSRVSDSCRVRCRRDSLPFAGAAMILLAAFAMLVYTIMFYTSFKGKVSSGSESY
jgi:cytochrome bd-type quinol oxidase subunit 1